LKAAILQSGYLPWLGYFHLINQADIFVFLDDVQWTTRDWRNRNRVRTPQGWTWLTVPVTLEKVYFEYLIKDVRINYSQDWQSQHLNTINHHYRKTPYFEEVYPLIENSLKKKSEFVVDLNYDLIFRICDYINIDKKKFMFSQKMNLSYAAKKDDRLLEILLTIGNIDTYISGAAASSYLEESKFESKGIHVEWHDYPHPYYRQQTWGSSTFISYLSVIDLLFNHGRESLKVLTGSRTIEKPADIQIIPPE
jgi:hypothetical protein